MSPALGPRQRSPRNNWEASRAGRLPHSGFLSQLTHWGPYFQDLVICMLLCLQATPSRKRHSKIPICRRGSLSPLNLHDFPP